MGSETPQRLATLVGCNYFHTRNELRGCINDVKAMHRIMVDRFGFNPSDMTVLTDEPGAKVLPTGQNIKAALAAMIGKAKPGDVLFFHYSGHGTTVPAAKPHHRGEKDEAIVPCDFNLITDVDFRELVNKLPTGTSLTIISDSCHSGGLIDKEKEQIGPMATPEGTEGGSKKDQAGREIKARYIPMEHVLAHLASLSGLDSLHVGDHLSHLHGVHASPKFLADSPPLGKKPVHPDNGILLSGCQADETSADMCEDEDTSKAYGAFSNAIQMVLADEAAPLTNRQLVTKVRHLLGRQGFDQHPCLYCSDGNADKSFLEEDDLEKHQQSGKHKRKAHKQLQELLLSDEA